MVDSTTASSIQSTSKDKFRIGSKAIVCQDADLRGDITVGPSCILHPRCVIHALNGPIILGEGCIVEELAIIINHSSTPMVIGAYNHFETASRVEAALIGSHNILEPRSRTHAGVQLGSYCVVGTACELYPQPPLEEDEWDMVQPEMASDAPAGHVPHSKAAEEIEAPPLPSKTSLNPDTSPLTAHSPPQNVKETIPDYTVIFGPNSTRRRWSGEGSGQAVALHHKHLAYLTETLPKYHKLKLVTQ